MRITSKGQVTIPIAIREKLGLLPDTEVDFVLHGNAVRLVKASGRSTRSRGRDAVARLKGRGDVRMTTDEILALTRRTA
jgi:AbrB family looped-hinge helix DNA binding protein